MKQTKHSRKSEAQNVQNVHHSREHMHSNDYTIAQSLPWWWCGPSASTPSADVLSTLSHHGSANGKPSLEGYPDAVVQWIQFCRIGWPHLWMDKIWRLSSMVTMSRARMNGTISVTSTLRHQVKDVHGTQHSKFTSMISIHLQVVYQKS